MTPIRFFAKGEPKGQPRPKAFSRGGFTRVYDPGTAEGWKGQVAIAAQHFIPAFPMEGPLHVELVFFFPRPKGHFGTGKNAGVLKTGAPYFHTSTPDADNLAKAVTDALTTLRMWKDDSQIARLIVHKFYVPLCSDGPGCRFEICELLPQTERMPLTEARPPASVREVEAKAAMFWPPKRRNSASRGCEIAIDCRALP